MKRSVGRPSKYEISDNDIDIVKRVIHEFHNGHNTKPLVKYKDIYEYCRTLFLQKLFPFNYGYDFWKREGRLGRQLIDEYNSIQQHKIWVSEGQNIEVVDIKDLLEKYGGEHKKVLEANLTPVDRHITRFMKEINGLQNKNKKLDSENKAAKKELIELNYKVVELQNLLLALFTYSDKNNELINMINLGKSKSEIINKSLEKTFSDPLYFIEHLKKGIKSEDKLLKELNVIPMLKKDAEYEL